MTAQIKMFSEPNYLETTLERSSLDKPFSDSEDPADSLNRPSWWWCVGGLGGMYLQQAQAIPEIEYKMKSTQRVCFQQIFDHPFASTRDLQMAKPNPVPFFRDCERW